VNVGRRPTGWQEIWPAPGPLLASPAQMAARRTLPLLVALWTTFAQAQTFQPVNVTTVIQLDGGGTAEPRAYAVYVGSGPSYVMAGYGGSLQVFDISGNELSGLTGQFDTFAVANGVDFGGQFGTLVAAASFEQGTCGGFKCLRLFRWDPVAGFQNINNSVTSTPAITVQAMTIDSTGAASGTFGVFYAAVAAGETLYRQDVSVTSDGGVTFLGTNNRGVALNTIFGLAPYAGSTLFVTSDQGSLNSYPTDLTNPAGGVFLPLSSNDFAELHGLSVITTVAGASIIAGDTTKQAVLFVNAVDAGFQGGVSLDAGGRTVIPTGAAATPETPPAQLIATESFGNSPPVVYLAPFTFPDGGSTAPDSGSGGGIPVIPSVPPGPGVVPPNTYGCSSAAGVPLLLTFFVPLLLLRRRR
jgi:hypothetical protein